MGKWPKLTPEQIEAGKRVLESGVLNGQRGPETAAFEKEFACWNGSRHAVAVANGTLALECALAALRLKPPFDVVVPARTFVATGLAVLRAGGRPVFADVAEHSGCLTAASVRSVLTRRTQAVIAVHLGGYPCDVGEVQSLGIQVIEDCAQAQGAVRAGKKVGSLGAIGCFSFCNDKIMTTGGEGGMVTTDDPILADRIWSWKEHGRNRKLFGKPSDGHYVRCFDEIGTNARITEVQSAIGRVGLKRIGEWVERRQLNAAMIEGQVDGTFAFLCGHAYYRLYWYAKSHSQRERILAKAKERGAALGVGSCPEIYMDKVFAGYRPKKRLPVAKRLGERSIAFLVDPEQTGASLAAQALAVRDVCTSSA
jgi:dTDP-4-amino-4,6-dideoxygalactose transaminase